VNDYYVVDDDHCHHHHPHHHNHQHYTNTITELTTLHKKKTY